MSNTPEFSRRDLLRNAALTVALGGLTDEVMADVHLLADQDKTAAGGVYKPKAYTASEWLTLRRLCDLIIPADEVSKGALDSGAPEFIDLLSSGSDVLSTTIQGGLHWLDNRSKAASGKLFRDATEAEQTAILDRIAFIKNDAGDLSTGVRFFDLFRRMTVDAFYTSKIGIADVGYKGNKGMTKFEVPIESFNHAFKNSPV